MKPTLVIGHKNPDTDSICSAICYADFKHKLTGEEYIPCRAGQLHSEAQFVLDTFGVEPPRYLESLEPKLGDVQYRTVGGIDKEMSLKRAWEYMRHQNIQTVPVLDENGCLEGLMTSSDAARFYIEDQDANALAEARTSYRNIVDALEGTMVVGDPDATFSVGRVVVAAANPDVMEDYIQENDMVILGNRYESQLCSIERHAGCIIIGLGAKVSRTIQKLAREAKCTIIATPLDTYSCAKLINQAVPVRHIMRTEGIISFRLDDPAAEVKAIVAKKRMRYFPIQNDDGTYVGMVSQRNLLDMERQKVILVDHNERDQAPADIRSAEIVEIIDHHRIDSVETNAPIYFRNEPLGATSTIIALMYQENHIEIEPKIAGLLCSGIVSDTLMFRSPTCTLIDKRIARQMAEIAGIDLNEHAVTMFNSGSRIMSCPDDAIFHMDYKVYSAKGRRFTVSQISSVSQPELDDIRARMIPYLQEHLPTSGMDLLFVMLTNIIGESTELLFAGKMVERVVQAAFDGELRDGSILLPGIVSQKEQMINQLIAAIDEVF